MCVCTWYHAFVLLGSVPVFATYRMEGDKRDKGGEWDEGDEGDESDEGNKGDEGDEVYMGDCSMIPELVISF